MLIPPNAPLSAHHPVTPTPSPTSPSSTPCSFPRVWCLSCFVILTDIFTHFFSFPFIPFTIFYLFLFCLINFLLVFNLSTYRITPSAHPIKCPPSVPVTHSPPPPASSPSTTPRLFPRVRSLYVLSPFLIYPTKVTFF